MLKRLNVYLSEMYPVIPRALLGLILFFEVYFLVILTNGTHRISIGVSEFVGAFTIFAFLMALRIADELKDEEVDKRLFPERPYPSGRVKKGDLITLLSVISGVTIILNLLFMNNLLFFAILVLYGIVMSLWFFRRHVIQKSLVLALVTHNPVQLFMNLYLISFACIKYGIPLLTFNNVMILFTLYFPGLIWEISRKTRAPSEETEYVTYSKLFGHKKPVKFILSVMFIDVVTTSILLYQLYPAAVVTVVASYLWLVWQGVRFMNDPTRFKLVNKIERYEYITEATVIIFEAIYIFTKQVF